MKTTKNTVAQVKLNGVATGVGGTTGTGSSTGTAPNVSVKKTNFFSSVELDPLRAKLQFSDVAEEMLMIFTQKPDVKVKISVEISAELPARFDDGAQRAVRENCNQLKFKSRDFDE